MEKYSGWRDAGTGIQPFLHPQPPRIESAVFQFVKYNILGPIQGSVKFCLILVLGSILFIADFLSQLLIVPILVHSWQRLFHLVIGRLILFLSGFYWIDSSTIQIKKLLKPNAVGNGRKFIIANHSSYLDILYFTFRYISLTRFSPIFLQVSKDGKVRGVSGWQMLGECSQILDFKDGLALKQYLKEDRTGLPLVIFPEGTTSNGRGVLQFLPVFEGFNPQEFNLCVQVVGLKYEWNEFCPCFTTGHLFGHYWAVLNQFSNSLKVLYLDPSQIGLSTDPKQAYNKFEGLIGSQLATYLAQTLRTRKVGKSALDKVTFLEYFNERENPKYLKTK
ncbi:hypothetical protein HDV06_006080 [Boothiomyces sp. JEL0866]|nr:hypothetical protein HDV06_006030 [Boothiomyces sp. JEL0866]KAJ3324822.1 hypothetical protein HDV06_006080 [Boothiomyces sp. JEL0866]